MKRVFALLCALALVLPMICTGAAAAEPEEQQQEQYVFELLPNIMYLDDSDFNMPFSGSAFFAEDSFLPDGTYDIFLHMPKWYGDVNSLEPVTISFVEDPDAPGVYITTLLLIRLSSPQDDHVLEFYCRFAKTYGVEGIYGTLAVFDGMEFEELFADSYIVMTPVSNSGVITVDQSPFSDFSYSNLSVIMLCGLGLSAGPALFWFAYRVIKKKVSRAFFNGKL